MLAKSFTLIATLFATLGLTACEHLPKSAHANATQTVKSSQYQHIRNATAKIQYVGKTFLIDPYLAEKGRYLPPNAKVANPLMDMPYSINEVLAVVDAVIVTHTHADHWDEVAQNTIGLGYKKQS